MFKRPLMMLRPGACLAGVPVGGWLGRAIPMHELLPSYATAHFTERHITLAHLAFGLALPMPWQVLMRTPPASASATAPEEAPTASADPIRATRTAIVPASNYGETDQAPAEVSKDNLVVPSGVPKETGTAENPFQGDLPASRRPAGAGAGWYSPRKEVPRGQRVFREMVTLLESPTGRGNARVRTEGGEDIFCRSFSAYPGLFE